MSCHVLLLLGCSECGIGATNTQVTCCSCKEAHDCVKGGEQVPSYLHSDTETSHVLMMADGRYAVLWLVGKAFADTIMMG